MDGDRGAIDGCGLVVAVVALIFTIIGVFIAYLQLIDNDGAGEPGTMPSSPAEHSPVTPRSDESPAASAWPGEPAGTRYEGASSSLAYQAGWTTKGALDLETRSTGLLDNDGTAYDSDMDLVAAADGLGGQGARFAPWEGAETPNLQQCRDLPDDTWTELIGMKSFAKPSTYCVQSNENRFGRLTTRAVSTSSYEETTYTFSYVLWKKPNDS